MNKNFLFLGILCLFVLSVAAPAYTWQGRMASMGDPFGLVLDESDFLIHPAGIADGKGVNFYGNYRFNWLDVVHWNYTAKYFNILSGTLFERLPFKTSGDEIQHDALVGATIPLGPGRLGFFAQYARRDGDFNGHALLNFSYNKYTFDDSLDAFALRVLYGIPMGAFKVGGEMQLGYKKAENTDAFYQFNGIQVFLNDIIGTHNPELNTFPFQFPYDSKWWEMHFKGSLEGSLGPGKLSATVRGGFIFSGENDLHFRIVLPMAPATTDSTNFSGDVEGWNMGGDLWWRTSLQNGLSLPLLLRVDYDKKTWDGKGVDVLAGNIPFGYGSNESNFQVEVGGGLDKDFGKGTKVAAGLYYNYLDGDRSFFYEVFRFGQRTDHTDYPHQREHRVLLKVAGEKEWCSCFIARLGLNVFYGWVNESYRFRESFGPVISTTERISIGGSDWGALVSLGGTVKFSRFSLEPFVSGGYRRLDLEGENGFRSIGFSLSMDKLREEWSLGGGFSIKY